VGFFGVYPIKPAVLFLQGLCLRVSMLVCISICAYFAYLLFSWKACWTDRSYRQHRSTGVGPVLWGMLSSLTGWKSKFWSDKTVARWAKQTGLFLSVDNLAAATVSGGKVKRKTFQPIT